MGGGRDLCGGNNLGFFWLWKCDGFKRLGTWMRGIDESPLFINIKNGKTNDLTLLNWTRKNADIRGFFCENS